MMLTSLWVLSMFSQKGKLCLLPFAWESGRFTFVAPVQSLHIQSCSGFGHLSRLGFLLCFVATASLVSQGLWTKLWECYGWFCKCGKRASGNANFLWWWWLGCTQFFCILMTSGSTLQFVSVYLWRVYYRILHHQHMSHQKVKKTVCPLSYGLRILSTTNFTLSLPQTQPPRSMRCYLHAFQYFY